METIFDNDHSSGSGARNIEQVAIIGAGWTGRQIAGQMIAHGVRVILCDESSGALNTSRSSNSKADFKTDFNIALKT